MQKESSILEEVKKLDQRELIQALMKNLALTRDKLAELIGCSRRQIDTWILPTGSKQRRLIDSGKHWKMQQLLVNHYVEKALIEEGRLQKLGDAPSGFFSTVSSINYPAIYRVEVPQISYKREKIEIQKGVFGWRLTDPVATGKNTITHEFLTSSTYLCSDFGYKPSYAQVSALGDKTDYWLSVVKLQNTDEWSGFFSGFMASPASFVDDVDFPSLISTKHGLFACTRYYCKQSNSQKLKGMIVYAGAYMKPSSGWQPLNEEYETVVVLPNGEIINGNEGAAYLRSLYGLDTENT